MRTRHVRLALAAVFAACAMIAVSSTSIAQAPPPAVPGFVTCEPNTSAVIPCPCGNNPSGPGRGCNNSLNTGGAALNATGTASLSADTVVFQAAFIGSTGVSCSNPTTSVVSILYEGTVMIAPIPWGDGVLCCGGTYYTLATQLTNGGMMQFPVTGAASVSGTAISQGDALVAGSTRCYFVAYRDACPTFCTPSPRQKTNSYQITWGP
jgi:hypothetical protein